MATYWAANNAGGSGFSEASPAKLSVIWGFIVPGDTVMLLDGTYQGADNMLTPTPGTNGTSLNRITVKAQNEGSVIFDGQWARNPVGLDNCDYFVLEGFNSKNGPSAGSCVALFGGSQHNEVRRVVAWDVHWNGNNGVFGAFGDATAFNLFEDCAAFGMCGRKAFSGTQTVFNFDQDDLNTFRRCYVQHQGSGDDGITAYDIAYNSYGQTYENCIGTYDTKYGPETFTRTSNGADIGLGSNGGNYATGANWGGIFSQAGGGSLGNVPDQCFKAKLLGSLGYFKANQRFNHNNGAGSALYWFRFVADCTTIRHAVAYIDPSHEFYTSLRGLLLEAPMAGWNPGTSNSGQNITSVHSMADILASNWGVGGTYSESSTVAGVKNPFVVNPGAAGATLCYRYVNGVLTGDPLWPWPMNERIKQASASAGAYAGPCLGCSGGRIPRVPIDVTADVESIFGTIPSQCRGNAPSGSPGGISPASIASAESVGSVTLSTPGVIIPDTIDAPAGSPGPSTVVSGEITGGGGGGTGGVIGFPVLPDTDTRLCEPFELPTASRYSDAPEGGTPLPDVYGDFSVGGLRGPIPAVSINQAGLVYAAAGHAVQSIDAVYVNDVLQDGGYSVSTAVDYEGQGTIATITFGSQPIGQVSWRGKGKLNNGVLLTNPIDQLVDLLTSRAGYGLDSFDRTALAEATETASQFHTAWVIQDTRPVQEWLTEMLFNVMGYWRVNGRGQLEIRSDDGNWPPPGSAVASIIAARDCIDGDDGVEFTADRRHLVNAVTVYYLWGYSSQSAASRLITPQDDLSVNAYEEVRKAVTLKGIRDEDEARAWTEILFKRQSFRTRVEGAFLKFTVKGSKLAHATVGDYLLFSWPYGPQRENGKPYVNEILRINNIQHDLMQGGAAVVSAVDTGAYLAEGQEAFDAEVSYDGATYYGGTRVLTPV